MLKKLSVKNFAIIEDLKVEFDSGFNVLTGQTGAGKSLIIDSIGLILGNRADKDMIRYGEDKAYIEAIFSYNNLRINEILDKYNINTFEDITIYREISISGKNIIKINGEAINLNILKEISSYLADIHVQHDTFRLINPDNYLSLLDSNLGDDFKDLLNAYLLSYDKYKTILSEYKEIVLKKDKSIEHLDILEYEHKEISSYNLYIGNDSDLEEEISKLSNFDKISRSLNETYEALEGEYNTLDNIYNAYKAIDKIKEYDENYSLYSKTIEDSYYQLDDIKSKIYKDISSLEYDDETLNELIEKENSISNLKKKYKKSIEELIEYDKAIALEIDLASNYDMVLEEKEKEVLNSFKKLKECSIKLTDYRKKAALKIEEEVIKECVDLDLEDTLFKISFNDVSYDNPKDDSTFSDIGVDKIDFLITLNKGEPLKSLHKTASGGELSRIMLAFKSYFSRVSNLSVMIFDEIDTGVSGDAALKIARKLKNISTYTQVLCITHLAQVAAMADNHLWIYKEVKDERTITKIKKLQIDERVEKIASMISGEQMSMSSIMAAKEMLNLNLKND